MKDNRTDRVSFPLSFEHVSINVEVNRLIVVNLFVCIADEPTEEGVVLSFDLGECSEVVQALLLNIIFRAVEVSTRLIGNLYVGTAVCLKLWLITPFSVVGRVRSNFCRLSYGDDFTLLEPTHKG